MTRWIFLFISIAVMALASTKVVTVGVPPLKWTMPAALAALIWLIAYFVATTKSFRTIYLLSSAFIIPLCVFHLSWVFIHAFGFGQIDQFLFVNEREFYARATWYTVMALGAIGIGISWVMIRRPAIGYPQTPPDARVAGNLEAIFWMGVGLLAASAVFFVMFIAVIGNPFAYARTEFFQTNSAGRGLGAFMLVFPGAVVTLLVSAQSRKQKIFAWTVAAFGAALLLFSGYRSALFFPILVAGALLVKTGKRIPLWVPAVVGLAVILVIPAITQVRQAEYGEISGEMVEEAMAETSAIDGFLELGGTLGVFAKTLIVVPNVAPYQYGKSYIVAVRNAIPNLGFEMQESQRAEGLRDSRFDDDALYNLPPSDWMTFYINPHAFQKGTGVGFSAIAEPYINFGYLGVLVYFVLLGALVAWLDGLDLRYHPWLLLLCSAVGWALLKTVRNTSGNFIKPLIFTLVVVAIWRLVSNFLPMGKKRTTQHRANWAKARTTE